jgi:hypothetical protein
MSKVEEKPVAERLKNGAVMLGKLWKSKDRCRNGWSAYLCSCAKKTAFCNTKLHWLILATGEGRELEDGEFGIALMMTASEWDMTGLVLRIEIPEAGEFRIAPKADTSMNHLGKLSENPESAKSVLMLMKSFPGAKMEFPEDEVPEEEIPE